MKKRSISARGYFLKDINPVVRLLIVSETISAGAVGLMGPIFALFIEDFIVGSNAAVVGLAAGIFLLSKSTFQIPLAHYLDKIRGEKDDFWFMFISTILTAIIPLFYLIIDTPLELYIIQFALGIITAATYPSFMSILTRHMDPGKEGIEWGIYFTLTDISSALLSIVGGFVAATAGFPVLIAAVVMISLLSAILMIPIRPYLKHR